jgi:hypothetical protein
MRIISAFSILKNIEICGIRSMNKDGVVYLTPTEIDSFRKGEIPSKLVSWELTSQEFESMILTGQIRIINEETK